jgi:hypothetical protein
MGAPGPKKKKVVSAKERANLRPHPEHLKRGGGKSREFVTQPELDFLNYILDGATKKDAWVWAGFPSHFNNCHELLQRPLIVKTLKELEEKRKDQSTDLTIKRREEREILLHGEFAHRLRKMKTHKYRGDESLVKMFEVGFKSTGAIQPVRVSNSANAVAVSESKPLYVPIWRKMQMENPAQAIEGETLESATRLETGQQGSR